MDLTGLAGFVAQDVRLLPRQLERPVAQKIINTICTCSDHVYKKLPKKN